MTWQDYVKQQQDEKRREERAREWSEIVKLLRLNLERDLADGPLTIEDTDQMIRALQKVKHLPDFGGVE